jgi:hypothetical protein
MFDLVLYKSILKYPTLWLVELITVFITVFITGLGCTEGPPAGGCGGPDGGFGGVRGFVGWGGCTTGNPGVGVPVGG